MNDQISPWTTPHTWCLVASPQPGQPGQQASLATGQASTTLFSSKYLYSIPRRDRRTVLTHNYGKKFRRFFEGSIMDNAHQLTCKEFHRCQLACRVPTPVTPAKKLTATKMYEIYPSLTTEVPMHRIYAVRK